MTFSEEKLGQIFETAKEYDGKDGAELVGINMEGPFISMEKRGPKILNSFTNLMLKCFIDYRKKQEG